MVLCVYAYRNWLQNARFSLLYSMDAKYRFDITFPNSFRNIEWSKSCRRKDFIYSLFYFFGGGGRGGGGWGWGGGVTARQDYFTDFEPSQSLDAAKTGYPQNKPHGHPQAELGLSQMWPELGLNPHRWDDERFRVLKVISGGLYHSDT